VAGNIDVLLFYRVIPSQGNSMKWSFSYGRPSDNAAMSWPIGVVAEE
jgi:hypothetical protein